MQVQNVKNQIKTVDLKVNFKHSIAVLFTQRLISC